MPTVPINLDGTFSVNIGTGGVDGQASIYAVSVVPTGTTPPQLEGANTFDLGSSSLVSTHLQRFGTELSFAGRTWGVKEVDAWLINGAALLSSQSVEVVINDFQFIPFVAGDFDLDADVDGHDFLKWQRDSLDPAELAVWQANYGGGVVALAAAVTIPEPGTMALALLAFALSRIGGRTLT